MPRKSPDGRAFQALFILPSALGEAILFSGLVRHVRERHPGARLTIATSALAAAIFGELHGLDELIVVRKRRRKAHWFELWRRAFRDWDLVVDARGSLLAYALPARRRVVYRSIGRAEREHRVVAAARLVGRGDDPPAPLVECAPATDARAARLLAGGGPLLAIGPGASWRGKVWPAERFVDVAGRLVDGALAKGRVMVVGGPGEGAVVAPLVARLGAARVIDLVGLDLPTTFACLKQARLFLGNDSGMMHTAAVAGVPTLGLFGPTPEAVFGPWSPQGATVRGPRPYAAFGREERGFDRGADHMHDLDAATVLQAALALVERTAPAFER